MLDIDFINYTLGGFFFISISLFIFSKRNYIKKKGRKTKGIIVGYETKNDDDTDYDYDIHTGKSIYYPIIQFNNQNGETVKSISSTGFSIKMHKKLPVRKTIFYLKEKEEYTVIIEKNIITEIFVKGSFIIGILLLIIAVLQYSGNIEHIKQFLK
jgi:hypothetical protein